GAPWRVFAVWLFIGTCTLCGAYSFGKLAASEPETGGLYVYLKDHYGSSIAFLYGWMCLMVMDPGLTAALALGFAGYARPLFGLSPVAAKLVAIGLICAIAVLNLLGTRLAAAFMTWLTWLKLAILL